VFTGEGFGGVGELAETKGAWIGVDVVGELSGDGAVGVAAAGSPSSFSSFFFFPNRVSIPMTVNKVQIGSRLVSWTSIRSTHFY
jgi:hypothetical protein